MEKNSAQPKLYPPEAQLENNIYKHDFYKELQFSGFKGTQD
jgi:hypothetical protein